MSSALQRVDHNRADIDLVQMLYRLQPARALRIDLDHFVSDHVDADEEHPVVYQLVAHRLYHLALLLGDVSGTHLSARTDVGARVVPLRHAPECGDMSVELDEFTIEQEDSHVAFVGALDISLRVDVSVL